LTGSREARSLRGFAPSLLLEGREPQAYNGRGVILFALMEPEEEDERTVFENGLFSEPGQ
jgi:hypothetical protein